MASTTRAQREPDMALVHEFIRVHGRRPSAEELQRYLRAQGRSGHLTRVRLGAARVVARL